MSRHGTNDVRSGLTTWTPALLTTSRGRINVTTSVTAMAVTIANANRFPVHSLGLAMTMYPNWVRPKIPNSHAIMPDTQNRARLRITRTAPRSVNSTLPFHTADDHDCLPVSQSVDVGSGATVACSGPNLLP